MKCGFHWKNKHLLTLLYVVRFYAQHSRMVGSGFETIPLLEQDIRQLQ